MAAYPVKVVRIVNPVAPGGNQETIARTVADQLTRGFGQPVVIESRPASSAIVGTRYVKSAPPAVIDLVGGHVMLRFDQVTTSLPFIRTGKLRAIGVSSSKRSSALPDVPTIEEGGLAGFHDTTFNGLRAPAGTPRDVIERLRDGVAKAVAVPEVRNRLLDLGIELVASSSSDEFAAFLKKQVEEFAVLARQAGITAN